MVSSAPVPSLDSVTLAPLTAPPDASVTVPRMEPVSTCAYDGTAAANKIRKNDATPRISRPPQKRTVLRCITILLKPSRASRATDPLPGLLAARHRIEANAYVAAAA